ncbi:replication initiation protein RepC [Sulfitobacter albidus]|uniref:Replication initiation protein RepC n=1 Tax=Sulfitobacter albidus TaxID=2829501 RepID=A0A975JH06_9RHOB|nr:plasmid replication protein RepC [Sulfitobacter albidus]QUJ78308.1 replication initiation protein RepC [Sulfitobacter albidus]
MDVNATTPFGQRPVTAGLMHRAMAAQQPTSVTGIDKWSLLRDLTTARKDFAVSDRDLVVLNALLSCHPKTELSDGDSLIVFPSNRTLSDRAHGMAESTLRRHLAALTTAGLIQRRDSPNGKRYAARGIGGDVIHAYGFDLRPLLVHAQDIITAAETARAIAAELRHLRAEITVLRRDAIKLCDYARSEGVPGDWSSIQTSLDGLQKQMRRKLCIAPLTRIKRALQQDLETICAALETPISSASDSQNERHHLNSNKDLSDLKEPESQNDPEKVVQPKLPLRLILNACPDIAPYARDEIRHWHGLIAAASHVRGMMGITKDAWEEAVRVMGAMSAATTVTAILQRVSEIKSPGGYLRALTRKAARGAFSPGPMIMALLSDRKVPS